MQIRTVLGDGTANTETEFDVILQDEDGAPYTPPAVVRCRPMDQATRQRIQRECEVWRPGPRGRGRVKEQDGAVAARLTLEFGVIAWTGITGADGQDLVCTPATMAELPEHCKVQLINRIGSTEDDSEATFRESARVV